MFPCAANAYAPWPRDVLSTTGGGLLNRLYVSPDGREPSMLVLDRGSGGGWEMCEGRGWTSGGGEWAEV